VIAGVAPGGHGAERVDDFLPLLAVETATTLVGAALVRRLDGAGGGPEVRAVGHEGGREHAELLAPAVAEVCGTDGLAAVRCVAVDVGPGRFTGLRVGVATAKALGQALGVGVLGARSTDVLAWAAAEWLAGTGLSDLAEGWPPVAVAVDARRGEVFAATYDLAPGVVPGLGAGEATPVRVVPPEVWAAEVEAARRRSGRVVVVGDGALRYLDRLASTDGVHVAAGPDGSPLGVPLPRALALLALDRLSGGEEAAVAASVVPEYGREADARVNWAQRIAPPVATAPGAGRGPAGAAR
jgi:tRNA threonylcarbamoyladenosine biosynthesis protein TsaB